MGLWDDLTDAVRDGWDDITPWDTRHEQQGNRDPYIDAYEDAAGGIAGVETWVPIYDDTGRLIEWQDAEGNTMREYDSLWEQLDTARDTEVPDLNSWMDEQGYEMYDPMARDESGAFTNQTMQDMDALIQQLTTGPTAMDNDAAIDWAAQSSGKTREEYDAWKANLESQSEMATEDHIGMSDEERAVRERYNRNELRQMEQTSTRLIDNIRASSGSVSRAYATADQAIGQINDAQLQQSITMINDDYMRKSAESDKAMQRYQIAEQNGQMSRAQYLDLLSQNKSMALQGYAQQVNTMLQQNQQYLQMYSVDMKAIEANINNIYRAIQMEMGIDEKSISDMERAYQREIAPYLLEMDIALQQLEIAESQNMGFEEWISPFASYLDMATNLVQTAAMVA